jgi:CubicO group peptidase (beta-lactamase class C family)
VRSSPPTRTAGRSIYGAATTSPETLTGVFSITKGRDTHLIVARFVQEGALALDEPVATLPLPLTLRQLLGHQAGRIGVDGGFSLAGLAGDRLIAERLRSQAPFWGTRHRVRLSRVIRSAVPGSPPR